MRTPAQIDDLKRATLVALEAAIREDAYSMKQVHEFCKNDAYCLRYGGLTNRIAYLMNDPVGALTLRTLQSLRKTGVVRRWPDGDARGQVIRWWPAGLYEKIKSEAS